MNGILRNRESLCDIRPDCHHHFDARGTSNAMFDELAERSLMSPLAGTKHTYVRLAITLTLFVKPLHFKLHILIGLSSYGISFVDLCLIVAFPVSSFLKTF